MGIVHVASGDERSVAEFAHGLEGLGVSTLLHQPSGRLGTHKDHDGEGDGGDEGRTELETPRDGTRVLDDGIGGVTCMLVVSMILGDFRE